MGTARIRNVRLRVKVPDRAKLEMPAFGTGLFWGVINQAMADRNIGITLTTSDGKQVYVVGKLTDAYVTRDWDVLGDEIELKVVVEGITP